MTTPKAGDKAPEFKLPTDSGNEISLAALEGKKVVLYFYPKDDTPGCTAEACDFRDNLERLAARGAVVVGISKDSPQKHDRFKDKYNLNFTLAADEKGEVCSKYGVIKEKSLYGRKYMGIERSTFLIDEAGRIAKVWRNIKVKGHITDIISTLEAA